MLRMPFYAHSGTPGDKSDWQTLPDHHLAVAQRAAEAARIFGLEKTAFIAGLFHDLGKYNPQFQRRLEGENIRVDHSTAGAAVLKTLVQGKDAGMAELICYAILGHHAGLPTNPVPTPAASSCGSNASATDSIPSGSGKRRPI